MHELHHNVTINASPAKVYQAIATEAGLRGWWTADSKVDTKVGGKAVFEFSEHGIVFRMKIDALDEPRRVRWICEGDQPDWKGTTLDWEISKQGDATVLSFVQRGLREMSPFWASCNSTWGELMYRLKDYVEGKNPGPHWSR